MNSPTQTSPAAAPPRTARPLGERLGAVWSIARRDFRSYFTSPIAYIVIAGFLLIVGWMFFNAVGYYNAAAARYSAYGKQPSISDGIIRPLFGNMNVILLFLMPFITMRLLAEERKSHTLELLMTSPVTTAEIVGGKFLSGFLFLLVMMLPTLTYPAVLAMTANPDWGPIVTSFIGTLLISCCYLSVGLFFSSMTENQIVAGSLTFATSIFLWLISWAAEQAGPVMSEVLNAVSLINNFSDFSQGVLNTTPLIYYLSYTFFGLFLTHRVLDSFRWR